MKLQAIDGLIILAYLASILAIGFFQRRKARRSKGDYLLGGKRLPWYLLGLSNSSGMFDVSGTMWLVTIGFVYGLKSIWIPWLWPVFNQIFLMVYLSMWLRRSNATTGAEWIRTRFGSSRDAELSHIVVVVFAIFSCFGYLVYGFVGLGKFVEIFVPWEFMSQYVPFHVRPEYVPHFYGIIFTVIAMIYSILGGMSSIVFADIIQYSIIAISSFVIAIIAMTALGDQPLPVPDGWHNPFFGMRLDMDWGGIIDEVNQVIKEDGYSLFSVFFMLMLFKGILASIAGPAPNYDMQKILATRSPREASLMSGSVTAIYMPLQYVMVTGFVVLALLYYDQLDLMVAGKIDFEQILPSAISEFVPVGLTGLLLAGLLAAFMGTFAGTLNAAQAYITNDLYLKYINKKAGPRVMARANYIVGMLAVLISIVFGLYAKNVNGVLQWIVSALYGGYISANVLKWYWWRFNGYGYFWGMTAGLVSGMVFPLLMPDALALNYWPFIFLISLAGSVLGTLYTKPTDMETLKSFYATVKPWGFWGPVKEEVLKDNPAFRENRGFRRDMLNVFVGIIWQTALVTLPIFIVIKKPLPALISLLIVVLTSAWLKVFWYNKLPRD